MCRGEDFFPFNGTESVTCSLLISHLLQLAHRSLLTTLPEQSHSVNPRLLLITLPICHENGDGADVLKLDKAQLHLGRVCLLVPITVLDFHTLSGGRVLCLVKP